eukprot:4154058-Pleurochrysis_carterae.AAC.2
MGALALAGANVVGYGFMIEKAYERGRSKLLPNVRIREILIERSSSRSAQSVCSCLSAKLSSLFDNCSGLRCGVSRLRRSQSSLSARLRRSTRARSPSRTTWISVSRLPHRDERGASRPPRLRRFRCHPRLPKRLARFRAPRRRSRRCKRLRCAALAERSSGKG